MNSFLIHDKWLDLRHPFLWIFKSLNINVNLGLTFNIILIPAIFFFYFCKALRTGLDKRYISSFIIIIIIIIIDR